MVGLAKLAGRAVVGNSRWIGSGAAVEQSKPLHSCCFWSIYCFGVLDCVDKHLLGPEWFADQLNLGLPLLKEHFSIEFGCQSERDFHDQGSTREATQIADTLICCEFGQIARPGRYFGMKRTSFSAGKKTGLWTSVAGWSLSCAFRNAEPGACLRREHWCLLTVQLSPLLSIKIMPVHASARGQRDGCQHDSGSNQKRGAV